MRYCHLKFVCNTASVKSTALQYCKGKKKHTLASFFFMLGKVSLLKMFYETLLVRQNKAIKIGTPNFWPFITTEV